MKNIKIVTILVFALSAIAILLWILILGAKDEVNFTDVSGSIDGMISMGKWMTYLTALITLGFVIWNIITHPGQLKRTLLAVGAFAVIVAISYAISTGVQVEDQGEVLVTANGSRWVGAGLYTFYALTVIAVLCIFWGIIKNRLS